MKTSRRNIGSEVTEVGITGMVILCIALGAVGLFSGHLQKIFQNEDSPIVMSVKMQNSSDDTDADGANARTNIDKNLLTTNLISQSHSDLTLGSEVGLETTGTAGGDSSIGGTYLVENPDALYDGDPTTTGNALLDAALAAKKGAFDLFNKATSALSEAELFNKTANTLNAKAQDEQNMLENLQDSLAELAEEIVTVDTHLDLLIYLKAAAEGITTDISAALTYTDDVNNAIIDMTNNNLVDGQDLLDLNQDQIDAQNTYLSLQSDYLAGEDTCYDSEGNPYACNTSGINYSDVIAAGDYADDLLAQVNGQMAAVSDTVSTLLPITEAIEQDAEEAEEMAENLTELAKDTLKEAFYDDELFDDCESIEEIIETAMNALSWWGEPVKNVDAAIAAIDLLLSASDAHEESKKYKADAKKNREDMEQLQETLDELAVNALTLSLTAEEVDVTDLLAAQDAQLANLVASDPAIGMVADELAKVQQATIDANDQVVQQQAYVQELTDQSLSASALAQAAVDQAAVIQAEAGEALEDAQDTIDAIVTYPE